MTEATAPKSPSAFPVNRDPSHPLYGFLIDKWVDSPTQAEVCDWITPKLTFISNASPQIIFGVRF
jgi:hypothetical protein